MWTSSKLLDTSPSKCIMPRMNAATASGDFTDCRSSTCEADRCTVGETVYYTSSTACHHNSQSSACVDLLHTGCDFTCRLLARQRHRLPGQAVAHGQLSIRNVVDYWHRKSMITFISHISWYARSLIRMYALCRPCNCNSVGNIYESARVYLPVIIGVSNEHTMHYTKQCCEWTSNVDQGAPDNENWINRRINTFGLNRFPSQIIAATAGPRVRSSSYIKVTGSRSRSQDTITLA